MSEHSNVTKVRGAYAAFSALDLPAALKDLSPNATFRFNGLGPLSGHHNGVDDITAVLIGTFEFTGGTQKLDVSGVFGDDLHAVVNIHETPSPADGATLDMDEVHVASFDDQGRITDLWDLPSDPDVHDRFFDGH
jgi:ketosteroid isomerase-like protein